MNIERERLDQAKNPTTPWKKWGPYLSERQWGTVREDYSDSGNSWDYFTHDQARSRTYRWGEDGLAGLSDEKQRLCFGIALWNGQDSILKERLFGLTNSEGNHGEDVKEYYFYLDSTPTHSYMKYLYKYCQTAYPYDLLVQTNKERSRDELEYELMDTGVFDDNQYFDVFVEYAKETPEDILIKITVCNRGDQSTSLELLPTLWFRNNWSWLGGIEKPQLKSLEKTPNFTIISASHIDLGNYYLYCENSGELLFTENETNTEQIFDQPNQTPYVKDAINNYIVNGDKSGINPDQIGTKVAAHYHLEFKPQESKTIQLRLTNLPPIVLSNYLDSNPFGKHFEQIFQTRQQEANIFYDQITPPSVTPDQKTVMRQALASMLWTKQYYYFDLDQWLEEHNTEHLNKAQKRFIRNHEWFHMVNNDIISMPDKWEYPWYAAWDLAFHTIALVTVDPYLAKEQLYIMLKETYQHPNGQLPAYEWNFSDVNPPVHAWATKQIYDIDKGHNNGKGDLEFLSESFHKLIINFTWWVNRKDRSGNNVFEGGFLGLDNIGVFDRSSPLPTGGFLEQADGTAWMLFFSQCMLEIAVELAFHIPTYQSMALKFFEHSIRIAGAMDRIGDNEDELWDEEDGFFYDVLYLPNGQTTRLKVRSMVGLLPLCASTIFEPMRHILPQLIDKAVWFIKKHPQLMANIHPVEKPGIKERKLISPINEDKLRRILSKMLDENEFLSSYGIRALSRYHLDNPYTFVVNEDIYQVNYEPAESSSGLFGGNSNWRGPIWFPVNILLIRSLITFYAYYGDDFKIECPTGSGNEMTLFEVAQEISDRLTKIFLVNQEGRRPVYGDTEKFQTDPHWKDLILFYEYFHGDNGAGIGASHQTGWTGLVARLIQFFHTPNMAQSILETNLLIAKEAIQRI